MEKMKLPFSEMGNNREDPELGFGQFRFAVPIRYPGGEVQQTHIPLMELL